MTRSCDCQGCAAPSPDPTNPPGQSEIRWRATSHARALARMRDRLTCPSHGLDMRSLAQQGGDEPAIALLDTWAMVADIVAFYTERIAQEGFLRTATARDSVRQHARSLGYELRPGVAAQVELVFDVETAPGAPQSVVVPVHTPVQTVPPPEQLPQTFETTTELEARGIWNTITAANRVSQPLGYGVDTVWLATTISAIQVDDHVLIVGRERRNVPTDAPHGDDHEKWDFRRVTEVEVDPPHATGWTRLTLHRQIGYQRDRELVATDDVRVYKFTQRLNLFGWNAPDPSLFDRKDKDISWDCKLPPGGRQLEIDGDVPTLVPGSWVVLEQPEHTEAFQVSSVKPDGCTKMALSGKITRVLVDIAEHLDDFSRNQALVYAVTEELPAAWMPLPGPVGAGNTLDLVRTEPLLPKGRALVVTGVDATSGDPRVEATRVVVCTRADDGSMRVVVEPELTGAYHADSVRVRANVVTATHGETAVQVLGSGDGRVAFPRFLLRRAPLTYIRATTNATGSAAELAVRVEGVLWSEVPSLEQARSGDQVFVVRQSESGETSVIFGDGIHGARLPTGVENVEATYRVGIGAAGAADVDQVRLTVRKPRGIAGVTNLAPSRDWASEETLEEARANAPQRVRTLDRAVSVVDYEDFARGYAGVGRARADLVWDGHVDTVVVSMLSVAGDAPSEPLLRDVQSTLDCAREARAPRLVVPGDLVLVGARLRIAIDSRYEPRVVLAAVRSALLVSFGAMEFATPMPASGLLVVAGGVEGVTAVTMPRMSVPGLPHVRDDLVVALPARWGSPVGVPGAAPRVLAAQVLRLDDALLDVEVTS